MHGRTTTGERLHNPSLSAGAVQARQKKHALNRCLCIAALIMLMALAGLASGRFPVSLSDVFSAFSGQASQPVGLVILDWRLPRILAALTCGASLGIAGALFQSLTRSPLGSPDILGIDAGAQTGVLLMLALAGPGFANLATGAGIGSLSTALVIGLLSLSRRHGFAKTRLVVIGVGMAAMLNAANAWLTLRADLQSAMSVAGWRAGSLGEIDLQILIGIVPLLAPLFALALWLAPALRQLELGDELAVAFGLRPALIRIAGLSAGIGMTATVSAIAGPIAFLALVAPQLSRFVTRNPGFSVHEPALMGAVLLLTADMVARLGFPDVQMPVGALTAAMGGIYLIWLLWREAHRSRGT